MKESSKIIILVIVAMLLGAGVAWAGTATYKLVMSKDKEVCSGMLKLFNEDLKKYGEIRYEDHNIFTVIKWEKMDGFGEDFKDRNCRRDRMARFDIGNTGKAKIVVKHSGCLRGNLSDDLYILDRDSESTSLQWSDVFESKNKIHLTGEGYDLKQLLPEFNMMPQVIGGVGVLYPFLSGEVYYISMTDLRGELIVIGKYKQVQEVEEICYYHRKSMARRS